MPKSGLTTGRAPFVEEASNRGDLYITQPYGCIPRKTTKLATPFRAHTPRWQQFANDHFLHGIEALNLPADRVPRLDEVNRRLEPLTGFQAKPVSGYVPGFSSSIVCGGANFLPRSRSATRIEWIICLSRIFSTT